MPLRGNVTMIAQMFTLHLVIFNIFFERKFCINCKLLTIKNLESKKPSFHWILDNCNG